MSNWFPTDAWIVRRSRATLTARVPRWRSSNRESLKLRGDISLGCIWPKRAKRSILPPETLDRDDNPELAVSLQAG